MLRRAANFLRNILHGQRTDRDLSNELGSHLDMPVEEKIRAGMNPEKGRRSSWFDSLFRDVRYGARALRKNPAFSCVAIATLALVIGANTAIFSAFYGLVFRHLPYKSADQLVMLWRSNRRTGLQHSALWWSRNFTKNPTKSFEGIATVSLSDDPRWFESTKFWGTQESVQQVPCSADFFRVLKAPPLLGRTFQPEDDAANAPNVAILTARFWRQHYGARNDVIGKTLSVKMLGVRRDFTIIGVMPEYVEFPYPLLLRQTDFWVNAPVGDDGTYTNAIARLNSGVNIRAAEAEINTILRGFPSGAKGINDDDMIQVVPLRSELIRDVRSMLWILVAALGFVLLIGCANVGNLLLVRGFVREKEFALRTALGAGRATLIRQLSIEALLLAVSGGFLGFLLAYWGLRGFLVLLPPTLHVPRFQEAAIDPRVLAATAAISMVAALLFGIFPTMGFSRINLTKTLRSGVVTSQAGGSVLRRPGSLLLVSEITLALVLLAGTALLTQSFEKLASTNARFQPQHLLTINFFVNPDSSVDNAKLRGAKYIELIGTIAALPGVRSSALASPFPSSSRPYQFQASTGGGRIAESKQPAEAQFVTAAFFQMLGYELQRGRWFDDTYVLNSPPIVVINQEMARTYWPDANPIGLQLAWKHGATADTFTIAGIVKEPPRFPSGEKANPTVYMSLLQKPLLNVSLLVRTQADPRGVVGMVREATSKGFPAGASLSLVKTGDDLISESMARLRFTMMLVSVFSGIALLLALIGIYGLISYYTAQRTREIGIRMALGATPSGVVKLILLEGMVLISAGAALGLVLAYLFGRGLASLLFGVHPSDPISLLGATIVLVAVGSIGFYIPAHRAVCIDPMVALHYE